MNTVLDNEIQEIVNKYNDKVLKEFENVVDLNRFARMEENIHLLTDEECVNEHSDLIKMAAKCDIVTGDIYIKKSAFKEERILVHEYIHRISRNFRDGTWYQGFHFSNYEKSLMFFNEAITEYFCWKIVRYDYGNPSIVYAYGIKYIKQLIEKIGENVLAVMYFNSDFELLKRYISDVSKINTCFYILFCETDVIRRTAAMMTLSDEFGA